MRLGGFYRLRPMLDGCIQLLPARAGDLFHFGGPSSRSFGRWRLGWPVGLHPGQNLMFPPAQTPAVRHLEWRRDQVLILLVGRASPDRGFRLTDQGRSSFNVNTLGRAAARSG